MQLKSTFAIFVLVGSLMLTLTYQDVIIKELFKAVTIVAGLFLIGTLDNTTHQGEEQERTKGQKETSR